MLPGSEIGPYLIEKSLGTGGMGEVYLARVSGETTAGEPGDPVALKVLHRHLIDRPGLEQRFLREAEIGKSIHHNNVVRTLDATVYSHDGRTLHALVMEHVEGRNLRTLLEEVSPVPEDLCLRIACDVAHGLTAIHEAGVAHRDLKPENILLRPDHTAKIMDLGVAYVVDDTVRLSRTGEFVGSFLYAAPEQLEGNGVTVDTRADLYSLGLTLFELSTGRHPFADRDVGASVWKRVDAPAPPPIEVNPRLSPFFSELVRTLLHNLPEGRFPSARTLSEVLEEGESSAWWRRLSAAPVVRPPARPGASLHGRDREFASLRALYEAARGGAGRVVVLCAEAGLGKTRLVEELSLRLEAEGEEFHFLSGGHAEGVRSGALEAYFDAILDHLGTVDLDSRLQALVPDCASLIPAFTGVLRGEVHAGSRAMDLEALAAVIVSLLHALAAERPTIFLVDNLHLAPAPAMDVFERIARSIPEERFLLVGASRPSIGDGIERILGLDHASRLDLEGLGSADLGRIIVDVLGSRSRARRIGFEALARADGNPQVAIEFARFLAEPGIFESLEDEVPPDSAGLTHEEVVSFRLQHLDDDDLALLSLASCCGIEFDPLLVAGALGMEPNDALDRLSRIERGPGLICAVGRHYRFVSEVVPAALQEDLSAAAREFYHLSLAREIADRAQGLDGVAAALCLHLFRGGRGEEALPHLRDAVAGFEDVHQYDTALELLEDAQALKGAPRLWLLRRKARCLGRLGRWEEENAAREEVVAEAERVHDDGALARSQVELGRALHRNRRLDEALACFDAALERIAERGDITIGIQARIARAFLLVDLQRAAEARSEFESCARDAGEAADSESEMKARTGLGRTLLALQEFEAAESELERSIAIAQEIEDQHQEAVTTNILGLVYLERGQLEQARAFLERTASSARQLGDRALEAKAAFNLGLTLNPLGRKDEALESHRKARALSRELGDRALESRVCINLGILSMDRARVDEAERYWEQALALSREGDDLFCEGEALNCLGSVHRIRGRLDQAREMLEQALKLAEKVDGWAVECGSLATLADTLIRSCRVRDALPLIDRAERIAERNENLIMRSRAAGLRSRAHIFFGRLGEALKEARRALELAEQSGFLTEWIEHQSDIGEARLILGELREAEEGIDQALTRARQAGSAGAEEELLLLLARVAEARGELGKADALSADALKLWRGETEAKIRILLFRSRIQQALEQTDAARSSVHEALGLARDYSPAVHVLARAWLATLVPEETGAAAALLEQVRDRVPPLVEMEAAFLLFRAGAGDEHLQRARSLLESLRDNAPEEHRYSMVENIPLHREILTANIPGGGPASHDG